MSASDVSSSFLNSRRLIHGMDAAILKPLEAEISSLRYIDLPALLLVDFNSAINTTRSSANRAY